jgi:hypothetical protein
MASRSLKGGHRIQTVEVIKPTKKVTVHQISDSDDESDDEPKKKTKAELAKDKKKSKKKEKTSEEMKVASHKLQQKRVINALAKADAELRLFLVSKPDIEQANECFFKLRESVYKRVKMLDEIQALKDS